jgi:hypothetical protein
MYVTCLRCKGELKTYVITQMTFLPYDVSSSRAMVECPTCGHVEFLAGDSMVLNDLEVTPTFIDEGD